MVEQSFVFQNVPAPPVPSLLRGFSAPVKLVGVAEQRLRFLAAHDTDLFVRWESGQQYATSALLRQVAAWRQDGAAPPADAALLEALEATLALGETGDAAFAAEALSLPSETFLADQMAVVDIDGIHAVREATRRAIGQALKPQLLRVYQRLDDAGEYRIDGAAIGRRALRNTCLAYLVAAGDGAGVRLAKAQFDATRNMTDVLAALAVLSGEDCTEREDALAAFYAQWRGDALVLDKWFAIQAMSKRPGTLDAVLRVGRVIRITICATRTGSVRWSAVLPRATRCISTRRRDADIGSWPIRSSRSTRPMARSRRAWCRRWVSGGGSIAAARR